MREAILADGQALAVSEFQFAVAHMAHLRKIDQQRPVATGELAFREQGGDLRKGRRTSRISPSRWRRTPLSHASA